MEEKDRYRLEGFDTSQGLVDKIYDTEKDIIICSVGYADDVGNVIELLNQQDKKIHILNEQSQNNYEKYTQVLKENQQLKQQLEEYSELGTPKEINDIYKSRNILNYNLQDANGIIDDLVKQLHDLPKKIVSDIKDFAEKQIKDLIRLGYYADERNRGLRPINYYDLMNTLNEILKKYGGEDEN